jgi:hypothetical protein
MKNNRDTIKDFMGIFPNAASTEYCEKVITRFDYLQKNQGTARGREKIWTRQEEQEGIKATEKDNDTYFLGGTSNDDLPLMEEDKILMTNDMTILREFCNIIWSCYDKYTKKYGFLPSLTIHKISPTVRIQKYKPSQGYHVWHCESGSMINSRRMLVVALYLNTVEEGGETEFLYQSVRVPPVQGTMALFPAGWTHAHRGNPPLSGNKYFMTTWLEFMD